MFFCLSGFVISYSGYLRPKKTADFLLLRIARIYPAYLFVAVLFVGCLVALPSGSFNGAPTVNLGQIIRTLLFDFGRTGGYVYVGWTLFYEMMFYLCFALVSNRFDRIAKTAYFYCFTATGLLLCYWFDWHRIADFLFGVSAFLIASNARGLKRISFSTLALYSVAIFGFFVHPVGAFCAAFILMVLFVERCKPAVFQSRLMIALGDSSYSIYLIQVLTISASLKFSKLIMTGLDSQFNSYYAFYAMATIVSLLTTLCAGILMRRHVEKPLFSRVMSLKK